MKLADLMHSLTLDGHRMTLTPEGSLKVFGGSEKLTSDQKAAVVEHKTILIDVLSLPKSEAEIEREAIQFADTLEAAVPLAETIAFFDEKAKENSPEELTKFYDKLVKDMKIHNPKGLERISDVETVEEPCPKCGSKKVYTSTIHHGEGLRMDCAGCSYFIRFQLWYGKEVPPPRKLKKVKPLMKTLFDKSEKKVSDIQNPKRQPKTPSIDSPDSIPF